jgi:glucose-6-phosphate isomerase
MTPAIRVSGDAERAVAAHLPRLIDEQVASRLSRLAATVGGPRA